MASVTVTETNAFTLSRLREESIPRSFLYGNFAGFIRHSPHFPIILRELRWSEKRSLRSSAVAKSTSGVVVQYHKRIPLGTLLEVTLPELPSATHCEQESFNCQVSLIRHLEHGYELGLCPLSKMIGHRLRVVEQICHIESWLRSRQRSDGPYVSRESLTAEWVGKYAKEFPSHP
ncbi:MAG: hypothetical protein ACYYK0_05460 [Candidatus Eutrophobiaceae bacterium]